MLLMQLNGGQFKLVTQNIEFFMFNRDKQNSDNKINLPNTFKNTLKCEL